MFASRSPNDNKINKQRRRDLWPRPRIQQVCAADTAGWFPGSGGGPRWVLGVWGVGCYLILLSPKQAGLFGETTSGWREIKKERSNLWLGLEDKTQWRNNHCSKLEPLSLQPSLLSLYVMTLSWSLLLLQKQPGSGWQCRHPVSPEAS